MKKENPLLKDKSGFTLLEVVVAVTILSFAIFSTLRVITASINSVTYQGKRLKALHLAQAHLARLAGDSFSKAVPEDFVIPAGTDTFSYTLHIYDDPSDTSHPTFAASQFIASDDSNWLFTDLSDDGILIADENGFVYEKTSTIPPPAQHYNWNPTTLTLTFSEGTSPQKVRAYYRYYHLIDEGGTIPPDDEDGIKKWTIKLSSNVMNIDGDSQIDDNIAVWDFDPIPPLFLPGWLSPSWFGNHYDFNPDTLELEFRWTLFNWLEEDSVWIYYLPKQDSNGDVSGPQGIPDGYNDPVEDSIVGVVQGNFSDSAGNITSEITSIKKVTVTEFWKQGNEIKKIEKETYLNS